LFQLAELELELNFVVAEDTRVDGGIDLKVITLGAGREIRAEQVQRVVVRFQVPEQARRQRVTGARAHPGAASAPDEVVGFGD
jgi:hypothetical protein